MPLRAVRSTSWAPFTCACVPAWATCRVAATCCTRLRELDEVVVGLVDRLLPRGGGGVGGLCLPACLGQREHAPAGLGCGGLDESLVLELLQGRVHRTGARRPVAAAALRDHLDDLVAVHRLLGRGGSRIAARMSPRPARLPGPSGPPKPASAGPCMPRRDLRWPSRPGRSSAMNQTSSWASFP